MAERVRISYMRFAVSVAATIAVLVAARDVLQPLLIALAIWFLLTVSSKRVARLLEHVGMASTRLSQLLSTLLMLLVFIGVGIMTGHSAGQIADQLPAYQERLQALSTSIEEATGIEIVARISTAINEFDFASTALSVAGSAMSLITTTIIIIIYIIFLNTEASVVNQKIAGLFDDPRQRDAAMTTGRQIFDEIETYIGVKVVLGLVQAVPTFILLSVIGLDAPAFWAVIIFITSFIPTVGTLIGIIFPTLMALIQFDTLFPFFAVLAVLLPVQLLTSNFLEPKMLSTSLDLSPLVVMLGIFAGGAVWGIVGALIIVPILSIATIVFARIPSMRPIAILISGRGELSIPAAPSETSQ